MNRIYLPYPLEVVAKFVSWVMLILIDLLELILIPIMRIGPKFFTVFSLFAFSVSGYVYFVYQLDLVRALFIFGISIIGFLMFICSIRLIKYVLVKFIRPFFANIVFESVAVSFRRPCRNKCV